MNNSEDPSSAAATPGLDDPRSEKSPGGRTRPIPPAYEYIQVNGCKTPGCVNFGVAPREGLILTGRKANGEADDYRVINSGSTDLGCKCCGRFSRLKSNRGVHEERQRQGAHLWVQTPLRCPAQSCANHVPDRHTKTRQYRRFGKTRSGSDRWQCCLCKKTFSLGKPTLRQRKPHVNLLAFNLLVNKVPISRMMEILGVDGRTIYRKIDFIYQQCRLFAAAREMQLPDMHFDRLYLSTDRQDYMVNWGDRKARKTIQLTAVATADLRSGYLFGLTPNFDDSIMPEELEADVEKVGDRGKPYAMRRHARLWTAEDYEASVVRSAAKMKTARTDLEAEEVLDVRQQLPTTGVQVHADYLMYGHYALLRYLFPSVGKIRFFLDQDAALLSACIGSFGDRVADRTADIIVVDINKDLKTTERQALHARAKRWFQEQLALYPNLTAAEVRTKIMADRIAQSPSGKMLNQESRL